VCIEFCVKKLVYIPSCLFFSRYSEKEIVYEEIREEDVVVVPMITTRRSTEECIRYIADINSRIKVCIYYISFFSFACSTHTHTHIYIHTIFFFFPSLTLRFIPVRHQAVLFGVGNTRAHPSCESALHQKGS
jgi:hypothetical protein